MTFYVSCWSDAVKLSEVGFPTREEANLFAGKYVTAQLENGAQKITLEHQPNGNISISKHAMTQGKKEFGPDTEETMRRWNRYYD